jgi:hypothetical protein
MWRVSTTFARPAASKVGRVSSYDLDALSVLRVNRYLHPRVYHLTSAFVNYLELE